MIMFFMIFFMVVLDLFSDHEESGGAKAVWIVFLILFPPITVLIYVIVRGNGMARRRQKQVEQVQSEQKAYIQSMAGNSSPADQIASAKALLDAGTISQQDFDALKAKALAS
ncbi:MAG: SHOCT domain-containing protein [Actinomycetota bacterium]|nr:SHOCT domain-containing protein [Actinomycetota bacterium]